MDQREQHPPDGPDRITADEQFDADPEPTPTEYNMIGSRLKDVRKRILSELYKSGGEASVTQLRADDGAAVPRGSLDHHLSWLRGEQDWWPENVSALVEVIRREEIDAGVPTRVIGLTPIGEMFAEQILDDASVAPGAGSEEVRMAISAHSDQITGIEERLDALDNRSDDFGERIAQLEDSVELLNKKLEIVIEQQEMVEEHLRISTDD
jgi:hypothetical protein